MKLLKLSPLILLLGLSACAVTPLPPPPATHPASPAATEAPLLRNRTSLVADEATQTTDELLRGQATESANPNNMDSMPGMNH